MARLAQADGVTESLKKHQATVLFSLKEEHADVSVRRRALDLLFVMCDHTNAQEIVGELLAYATSPEADVVLREELVLKVR
jgi:AP-2 complex subunit alpha